MAQPAHIPIPEQVSLLPVLRAILETQTAIGRVSGRHIEGLGLTPAQFDVLAVLGDTAGMTCKELGAQSLITKGTLAPVLDRLEARGLVTRTKGTTDARQTLVALTPAGQGVYEATFMVHVDHMRPYFEILTPAERDQIVALLAKLRPAFA